MNKWMIGSTLPGGFVHVLNVVVVVVVSYFCCLGVFCL